MSNLINGNKAFKNNEYRTAREYYLKARESFSELRDTIDFNISICDRKLSQNSSSSEFRFKSEVQEHNEKVEYYPKDHVAARYLMSYQLYSVDIIIPIYNALEDVKRCLKSVADNRGSYRGKNYIVNDASDRETTEFLRWFVANNSSFQLIEHEHNCGYTKTVNDGIRASTADYVVTLNSDTVVTKGWLQGLIRCIRSGKNIGIVGPLSNAASWQNVPKLLDENNQFAVNDIPSGFTPNDMAETIQKCSWREYPRVPFVNGFCFMISREVIAKIGLLDEDTFPTGYGEENDYCIRALNAGFELAIADDVYVYHAKSKSFGHEKRKIYSKNGMKNLKLKHGEDKVSSLARLIRDTKALNGIRERISEVLLNPIPKDDVFQSIFRKKILFLLPVSGGGGGVHSIVQETMGMRRLGVLAKIAVPKKHRHRFIDNYKEIDAVEDLFVGFESNELIDISKNYDVIVGTIFTSIKMVKEVVSKNSSIKAAYYIQDYEPLFFEQGTPAWHEAKQSYNLIPEAILFAKTDWICQKVLDEHGVKVRKVAPSIDHDIYKPDPLAKLKADLEDKTIISAMIRPKTPRRGAERTMKLLKTIYDHYGDKVHIEIFGCEDDDPLFVNLNREFSFKHVNHGILSRSGVASVLQRSDCFIDLSDYQAFGRTGLEAMACGAFPILTKFGGVYEYAEDGKNCIIVDPFKEVIFDSIRFCIDDPNCCARLKNNAIYTASNYSIHKAALSELSVLSYR